MRLRLCAALLLFVTPLHGAEDRALRQATSAIESCLTRLDSQIDIGYERVAARCPTLGPTLERGPYAPWLPRGWNEPRNNLSAGGLGELRAALVRESSLAPVSTVPGTDSLDSILATMTERRPAPVGVWSRFKQWIRDLIEERARPNEGSWFERMVTRSGVSGSVMELAAYVALVCVVLLALAVLLNELRLAGIWKRGRVAKRSRVEALRAADPVAPTMAEIEQAPLPERPRLLLELLSAKLTSLSRLPPANGLTARELALSADLHDAEDRDRLVTLARVAERARYAATGVPATLLESALEQGRELLRKLEALGASGDATGRPS